MTVHHHETPPRIDWATFIPAMLLVAIIALSLLIWPEQGAYYADYLRELVTRQLGWLYLILGVCALAFALWLAFGRYGNVVLGQPGVPPEYSDVHWVAMMFTCGIGGSLIAWGIAEPVFYMQTPPFGVEPLSAASMEWAHVYPIFHWGIMPWAFYAIPAVPIAYMLFVRDMPMMKISAACEPFLPKRWPGFYARSIDLIIALGILGGTATSLGLGVPLVSALVSELLGIPDQLMTKAVVLFVWFSIFGASAWRGLDKGIKILADLNMGLVFVCLAFILIVGPTLFILSTTVNSLGMLIDNFARMSLWTDPVLKSGFPEDWTVFYWAWWIAFAPYVGLFVGRISRGRTIRQVILGTLGWGTLGTTAFLAIIGGYAIHLEASGQLSLTTVLAENGMSVVSAKALAALPWGKLVLVIFISLSVIFYATTFDSASYTVASVCSRDLHNDQEPLRIGRLSWALALAVMALGLLVSGSYQVVQSATVVSSVPLLPILILMCVSLVSWLKTDFGERRG